MKKVDQRGFDNQSPPGLVSSAEAVKLLGVKRQTLYAYASRGLIRSVPGEGGRGRRYAREDLDRLRARHDARSGHGAVAAGALRWGEPVLETRLSAITARGPRYTGHDAVSLAEAGTAFERVAELLFTGALPAAPVRWSRASLGVPAGVLGALIPVGTPPAAALMAVVPALALRDPDRAGASAEAERARGRALIRRLTASLALTRDPRAVARALEAETTAEALAVALGAPRTRAALALLDMALVLWADHELNASTFTARVAASSGADLYACVGAALCTHSGPLHGGAVDRVDALVAEVGQPARAGQAVRAKLQRGEAVAGFGQPLYPQGDPRAVPLLAAAERFAPRNESIRAIRALCAAMARRGQHPTIDLATVAAGRALGIAPGLALAIFAIGRSAGWIAHALEQRTQSFLVRPRARYIGP